MTHGREQRPPGKKIAYLCSLYPAISHTFVLREVEALRRLGIDVETFSIHRAAPEQLLAHADHEAFSSTYAILPPDWKTMLAAGSRLLTRSPRAFIEVLFRRLRAARGARNRLWQLFYFAEAVVLWHQCSRRGIRHIHAHMGNVASDAALIAAEIGSAATPARPWSWSFTLHGPDELFETTHFRLAEKIRAATFVVCISDFTRSQLMRLSEPRAWDKLHVVHVGIPLDQFSPASPADSSPQSSTILFIGRHVPQKGPAVLLRAARLLIDRGHSIDLVLAGDGPQRAELEQLACQLDLGSVARFPGAVGQDEIRGLYSAATAFCLPSFAEGVPCVLMEAMAMEVPVISTKIAGIPELIDDGRTGLLVSPGRADLLADALEAVLRLDSEARRKLTSAARETVLAEFDALASAQRLRDLLLDFAMLELDSSEDQPRAEQAVGTAALS
jgi:glycosyltransferase involved in cell wall biosynthesis